jgi:molecular chaperone GrpE
VVRDKRRLDPVSGELREPSASTSTGDADAGDTQADPEPDRVAELTADLQRLSAEYANYRKRVERDRVAVVEMATAGLLSGLLPVLDDIDRAREHGDVAGPFAAVADSLTALTEKLGLEKFGDVGEPFDPSVHEALMAADPDPAQTVATCAAVLQKGYRLSGGRVLRPARVSVADPGAAES